MVVRVRAGKVDLYPGEPKGFVNDPDGPVIKDLYRRSVRVKFEARKLVRVRTGKLLSTIDNHASTNRSGPYAEVYAGGKGVRYTLHEHYGTVPHEIRARRKKALRFMVGGKVVFRKKVNHPGTTGTLFLTMALDYGGI